MIITLTIINTQLVLQNFRLVNNLIIVVITTNIANFTH